MAKPKITDADFTVVDPPLAIEGPAFRFRFWPCFWWAIYTAGIAGAAYQDQTQDRGFVVIYVVMAALIVPAGRLFSSLWGMLTGPLTTDQEAQQLRRRLLSPQVTTVWSEWARRARERRAASRHR